jgi:hypothetical protein
MGMTRKTFLTKKDVHDFLQTTEKKAKENAKRAVQEYMSLKEVTEYQRSSSLSTN